MKSILFIVALTALGSVTCLTENTNAAQTLQLGALIRNANGKVRFINQYEAIGTDEHGNKLNAGPLCAAGTHLPTIREFAEYSQSKGAKGILEKNQVDAKAVPAGYSIIRALNPDKTIDEFYFNYTGYQRPTGGERLITDWMWSSSVGATDSSVAYGLNWLGGDIEYSDRVDNYVTVRCALGQ